MPDTYEVVGSVRGLKLGSHVTKEQLEKDHARLGGVDRLLSLNVIKPAVGSAPADQPAPANDVSGSPLPLRTDMDFDKAVAINTGQPAGDAAARKSPPSGEPGKVEKVTTATKDAKDKSGR